MWLCISSLVEIILHPFILSRFNGNADCNGLSGFTRGTLLFKRILFGFGFLRKRISNQLTINN